MKKIYKLTYDELTDCYIAKSCDGEAVRLNDTTSCEVLWEGRWVRSALEWSVLWQDWTLTGVTYQSCYTGFLIRF